MVAGLRIMVRCPRGGCSGSIERQGIASPESGEGDHRNVCTLCGREFTDATVQELVTKQLREAQEAARRRPAAIVVAAGVVVLPTAAAVPKARTGRKPAAPGTKAYSRKINKLGPAIYGYAQEHGVTAAIYEYDISSPTYYKYRQAWRRRWLRLHGAKAPAVSEVLRDALQEARRSLAKLETVMRSAGYLDQEEKP